MLVIMLGGLILLIPIHYIWTWWTDGSISGGEAIFLSVVALSLFGQLVAFPDQNVRVVIFLFIVASAFLLPRLGQVMSDVANRRIEEERIAQYQQTLAEMPHNIAARVRLARTLYKIERIEEAIAEMTAASEFGKLDDEEARTLARWKEEERIQNTVVFCRACGAENLRRSEICVKCGGALVASRSANWARSGGPWAMTRAWGMAALSVFAYTTICFLFPRVPTPSLSSMMIVGGLSWVVFYVLDRRKSGR